MIFDDASKLTFKPWKLRSVKRQDPSSSSTIRVEIHWLILLKIYIMIFLLTLILRLTQKPLIYNYRPRKSFKYVQQNVKFSTSLALIVDILWEYRWIARIRRSISIHFVSFSWSTWFWALWVFQYLVPRWSFGSYISPYTNGTKLQYCLEHFTV